VDVEQDAFGRALLDHLNGHDAHSIIERDEGFVDLDGGPAVYFEDYPKWATIERRAMRYVRGDVLDIGCGAGRVALYLQERGHEVTGTDVSPLAVKVCKLRGVGDARTQSITSISSKTGVFDTIVMMGNNFGLMGGATRATWSLRRMHRMTSSAGRIVATSTDVYATSDPSHRGYQRASLARGPDGGGASAACSLPRSGHTLVRLFDRVSGRDEEVAARHRVGGDQVAHLLRLSSLLRSDREGVIGLRAWWGRAPAYARERFGRPAGVPLDIDSELDALRRGQEEQGVKGDGEYSDDQHGKGLPGRLVAKGLQRAADNP
jgi:SAM-dependent methyltransferase